MIYTKKTKIAMDLMFEKHKNQKDKSGSPYVFHPWHVAEQMDDEDSTCLALMHDLIEDTNTTIEEIKNLGFNDNIIDALALLSRKENEDYFEYIKKIAKNPLDIKVKLADLKHNSDETRLTSIKESDIKRQEKYKKAINYLEKIEANN